MFNIKYLKTSPRVIFFCPILTLRLIVSATYLICDLFCLPFIPPA
ncbi:hypothetical protein EJK50_0615 [Moraxella catarrhalis]|nr:hypothetical protein EJK50_0615 [Moraxella catarrhalis]